MIGLLMGLAATQALGAPVAELRQPAPFVQPAPLGARLAPADLADLQRKLEEIATVADGEIGLAVIDLQSGRRLSVHGDRPFAMASTVKVAIAATYLAEVEAGRRTLADMIAVDDRLRLRADGITFFAPHPGVSLSAANLIELMLTRSDNTATDVLLHNLGGPATVEAWLMRNHVTGMRIDRTIAELLLDLRGEKVGRGLTAAETLRPFDPVAPGSIEPLDTAPDRPQQRLDRDLRDTATPAAFADFLGRLYKGELLKPASRDWLIAVMRRCLTGSNRIKGLLPAGTAVEHKTGTLSGVTDDVGFISLPDGRRVIVAAFARGGANRPAAIARAARAVYDAFATPR